MSTAKERRAHKDHKLIRECIRYAQAVGAFEAGFKADPTGDSEFAGPAGNDYIASYNASLKVIARLSATTMEGVAAKSRIVPLVIQAAARSLDAADAAFFLSLAADVDKILEDAHKPPEKPMLTVVGAKTAV